MIRHQEKGPIENAMLIRFNKIADRSILSVRGTLKKPSIFKDIVQIRGREVNPIAKN